MLRIRAGLKEAVVSAAMRERSIKTEKLVSQMVLEKPTKEGNSPVGENLFHTS